MSESPQPQALVAVSTPVDREDDANPAQPGAAYQLPVLDHMVSLCKLAMPLPQGS